MYLSLGCWHQTPKAEVPAAYIDLTVVWKYTLEGREKGRLQYLRLRKSKMLSEILRGLRCVFIIFKGMCLILGLQPIVRCIVLASTR